MKALKFSILLMNPDGGSDSSFRIDPQGLASSRSGFRDAPDFTIVLVEMGFDDFEMGWWEVKIAGSGVDFIALFLQHYPQLLRYAKRMMEGNEGVDRIITMFSCGNDFILLEWARPRTFQRDDPPPVSPDLPTWVAEREHQFYEGLDDDLKAFRAEPNLVFLQSRDRASLSAEECAKLDKCLATLTDIEKWNPAVIFFGEKIFDMSLSPPQSFTSAFLHALELLFTPYDDESNAQSQTELPVPHWRELAEASIFHRPVPPLFAPTTESSVRLCHSYLK